ncbi:hypothetical protein EDD16DRAFT_1526114 [Pisolithus croceorrhizus]|nr:hypothetical protein EV401DRAFT_1895821 [Pisolithus croceorrhizus]KAI6100953.1 hypothetical protein EDD16DRAFT_1526114 [Pisolithus croceorrhizus]KAI6167162.1 hypothetical protein EDD17DRAFT_1504860 [Pisolithus thermaeus]
MLHSFLQSYFPQGGYNFSQLGFTLGTPESMELYEKAASGLAKTLSPHSRVVLFLTTHGGEERGDLLSFHHVKKAAQIFNPRSMLLFNAPHLQLAAGPYLHSLLDNPTIQGYDVSSAALFALHDSAMLGRHSNIVLIFWKSGDMVVEKLVWTDKNIRPWGNYLPVQCPQCRTMQKWVGGSANKTLSYEGKYIDCGKKYGA